MSQEILNIILSAVSIVVTGLVGWGVKAFTQWLNSKIQDQTAASHLTQITIIVTDAVQSIFQSFVDSLKKNGSFDAAAQQEAKNAALNIVTNQLTPELKKYIVDNYGDLMTWLNNKVESVIYELKATNKTTTENKN